MEKKNGLEYLNNKYLSYKYCLSLVVYKFLTEFKKFIIKDFYIKIS